MKDYFIHHYDNGLDNLPIFNRTDYDWRELLIERWASGLYLVDILTEEETNSNHLWRMPKWASSILDLLPKEQFRWKVPNWADVVIAVCLGEIDNLQEINWRQTTDGWRYSVFDKILACIPDERLAIAILQCAIKEAEADFSFDSPSDKSAVVTYCQKQIEYIQSRDMFDLATILQADRARLDDVEERLGEVESKLASITTQTPAELSSEDAQAILKRAEDAGLCVQEQGGMYKWLKSPELLGYFIEKMFGKGISFRKGENISWIGWKNFFNTDKATIEAARQKVNNYTSHMGKYPDGYLLVDNVIAG